MFENFDQNSCSCAKNIPVLLRASCEDFDRNVGKFQRILPGDPILFEVECPKYPTKYIFVGHNTYRFDTGNKIASFFAIVDPTGMLYPIPHGEKNIHYMIY